jgi:hypothetical protein
MTIGLTISRSKNMIPTIYGILILIIALFTSLDGMIYMMVISTLFGATSAATVAGLGGATVTPAIFVLPFLIWRVIKQKGIVDLLQPMSFLKPGFWLLLLTVWGVISAFTLPRLFEGTVMVYMHDRNAPNLDGLSAIAPVSTNITQTMYAVLGLVTYAAVRALLERPDAYRLMAKSVLWLAGLNVVAAVMDLSQYYLGMFPLLAYLKNANYNMLGGEVAGLMRIAGTFPETSAFSQFTLMLVAFCHILWIHGVYKRWAMALTLLNLGFLAISTSGTAYVGLTVIMTLALAYCMWMLATRGRVGKYSFYLWAGLIGILAAVTVIVLYPSALNSVIDYFNVVIGRKMSSDSGQTRGSWNAQAFQNFFDTFGIGTGLGTNHASSFLLVLLSNLGWLGVFFFGMFFWGALTGGQRDQLPHLPATVVLAARHATFVCFLAVCISGRVYDPGAVFYLMAAASAVPRQP